MSSRLIHEPKEIPGKLIACATIPSGSSLTMIDYISDYLEALGARIFIQKSDCGQTASLFATFGPEEQGGLVPSGHTDVVAVEGQDWASDPLTMVEREGHLYGRGTCDMKGLVACSMATAREVASLHLTRPLHLVFTYNEEVGPSMLPALSRVWWG
ncbi:MAG: M20/M25/M40 family metallo-hydrolase [Mesorhizobium sp.]|nr:MAG: M20/M25/M40 family metallo-hydrolase [Mesorhizobium sp.]